jgi:hypothetical protein
MISSCLDVQKEVEGKRVEFKLFDYDVSEINYSQLMLYDSKYLDTYRWHLLNIMQVIIMVTYS